MKQNQLKWKSYWIKISILRSVPFFLVLYRSAGCGKGWTARSWVMKRGLVVESNGQQERWTAWTQQWRVEAVTWCHKTQETMGVYHDRQVEGYLFVQDGRFKGLRWIGTKEELTTMFTLSGSSPWLLPQRGPTAVRTLVTLHTGGPTGNKTYP